jgi:hypothetical protein
MKYYLALKKNDILSFAVKWMKLEIILLSGISQAQKNVACSHLFVESRPKVMMMIVTIKMTKITGHEYL